MMKNAVYAFMIMILVIVTVAVSPSAMLLYASTAYFKVRGQ
jgi:hypothetical protein